MTRCSVDRPAGLLPALTAGLTGEIAIVFVGPPLLASVPNIGSVPGGRLLLPVIAAPVWMRIRLKLAVAPPSTSGAAGLTLLAMIELVIDTDPPVPNRAMPPPPCPAAVPLAVFAAIVLLCKSNEPPPPTALRTAMPPPLAPAVLLAIVPFRTDHDSAERLLK